ncbi:MAG: hypothetical protein L3J43_09750 [Sulfurovum sp.]|nr:hypothetical protein [Sulfurovum sp.]
MKNILILFLLFTFGAFADFMQKAQQTHIRGLNTILFFASEDIISSGHFKFKSYSIELDNYFFPFSFPFESDYENVMYYVDGSLGFSNYKQKNINLDRGTIDGYNLHNYAFKLGTGIQYNISKDIDLKIGASYNYSVLNASYKSTKKLNHLDADDKVIDALLNDTQQYHTIEVSSGLTYHSYLYNHRTYSSISMRHFSTYLNANLNSKSVINSTIFKLKVGLITPPISKVFGLSLALEPYASLLQVYGDIEHHLDLDTIYIVGNTFRLNAYPVTCWVEDFTSLQRDSMNWVREITFDMNIVKGHNFKGFNIGLGIKF